MSLQTSVALSKTWGSSYSSSVLPRCRACWCPRRASQRSSPDAHWDHSCRPRSTRQDQHEWAPGYEPAAAPETLMPPPSYNLKTHTHTHTQTKWSVTVVRNYRESYFGEEVAFRCFLMCVSIHVRHSVYKQQSLHVGSWKFYILLSQVGRLDPVSWL